MNLYKIDHSLIKHKMSLLRKQETSTIEFRRLVKEISMLMCYEVTKELELEDQEIQTPLTKTLAPFLKGQKVVIVPILRAGLGMVDGILEMLPSSRVGHVGIQRNETTLEPEEYFVKLPKSLDKRLILLVDPMLATGGSIIKTLDILKENQGDNIKIISLLGCEEGIKNVFSVHPDVDIYISQIDEKLNEKGYIVPGLGDAGDRLFGTKE